MKRLLWLMVILGFAFRMGTVEAGSTPSSMRFHQEVEVPLIEVPLAVEDHRGDPVSGLTARDITVFLDGQRVTLRSLASDGVESLVGKSSRSKKTLPHLVICLDYRFLEPGDLAEVLPFLGKFLEGLEAGEVLTSLFFTHGQLEMVQAPSGDPRRIDQALRELQQQVGRVQVASEYRAILQEIARPLASGLDDPSRDQNAAAENARARVQAFSAELDRELRSAAGNLERLVPLVAGLPGRKTLLYIGGRLPTQMASRLDNAWRNAFGRHSRWAAERAQTELVPLAGPAEGPALTTLGVGLFEAAMTLAGEEGILIHTVDAGSGSRAGSSTLQDDASNIQAGALGLSAGESGESLAKESALSHLAAGTGGLAGRVDGKLEEFFRRFDPRGPGQYTLSFEPSGTSWQNAAGILEVQPRSLESNWKLHYPRRVHLRDRDQRAVERTVSALLLETPNNSLGAVVEARPVGAGRRNLSRLAISVRLPLANLALLAEGASHVGRISLFATSGNLASGVQPVHKAVLPVEVRNDDLLTALGRDVEYKMEISVSTVGSLAIGIRDDFAPQLATVVLPVRQQTKPRSKAPNANFGGEGARGVGAKGKTSP
ncbi:MAG: VWA domain-containing protein [Deltaproteobacteria bacterium]|nr:VWA domain-containing protein [Deltaproteobacteria bacterium]